MIKIEHEKVYGWQAAIRGMRNPLNSWEKSDTNFDSENIILGANDLKLMQNLVFSGQDHSKFMRMIIVNFDITAPLYWWKEFDTYKVGTVANSCSTMHTIHYKEFTLDDFSHEHLLTPNEVEWGEIIPSIWLNETIILLNQNRKKFIETKDKRFWWNMIQLLPSSYNQKRTVMLNYQVLQNIYHARKNHKLDEWRYFCNYIEKLPYFADINQIELPEFDDIGVMKN